MEDTRKASYDAFENTLLKELVKLCTQSGLMGGQLLSSDDIAVKWNEFARDCMTDAVHNFNEYPEVALAWPAYLGMGVASHWDKDWIGHRGDTYSDYYGSRGYDDMDEHIVRDIMGLALDSEAAVKLSDVLGQCADLTMALIRREGFESQSIEAYHILIRCVKVMFQIGESIGLFLLGYKLTVLQN